ncbi:MAG TPA: amidohydrolase family protein [Candidatus Binataceae bacterium]|nr:amidohydrolase family protein [Candidatus Binataceae bacterium]
MAYQEEKFHKLKYPGAIDADGHFVEGAKLWLQYSEAKYKPRALQFKWSDKGVQYLEINGRPSKISRGATISGALFGRMEQTHDTRRWDPNVPYGECPDPALGAMDGKGRAQRLDKEGLKAAIIYPTLALQWETECDDADYAQAMCRAYNRAVLDWCNEGDGRLFAAAHLSLGDPQAAAVELERAVKAGCKGGWVSQFTMTRKPHAHPDHDVLFAKAQELDVPLGIHPSWEPPWAFSGRYAFEYVHKQNFWVNVTAGDSIRQALTSFMQYGTLEKFPRLKLVLLEAGAGWISYWLDRMDAAFASYAGRRVPLKEKPSFYFHRNVWISADPDERALPAMVELEGEDKFFWASDFPHSDHVSNYIEELEEMAGKLSPSARPKVLGDNVARLYKLDV